MRKIVAIVLVVLGIITLVVAITALVWNRFSLPPWSVQTEGRWAAYGIHVWAFLVGELPLGLALLLGGLLLWPSRLTGLAAKGLGAATLIIALTGLLAFASLTYSALCNLPEPSGALPTVLELFSFLMISVAYFALILMTTVLAGGMAWKLLRA